VSQINSTANCHFLSFDLKIDKRADHSLREKLRLALAVEFHLVHCHSRCRGCPGPNLAALVFLARRHQALNRPQPAFLHRLTSLYAFGPLSMLKHSNKIMLNKINDVKMM
jgi:hypothetical protein